MRDEEIIGAIIGGFIGFVIATAIASPRFTYLGGHWGSFEGGLGCLAGLVLRLVLTALGAFLGGAGAGALG